MAYGYKDIEYFKLKIHQHCGLLNPRLNTLKTTWNTKDPNIIKGNIKKDKILELLFTDIYQFLLWAESEGYKRKDGYINKCHICLDIRKFLFDNGFKFDSLNPIEFYSF